MRLYEQAKQAKIVLLQFNDVLMKLWLATKALGFVKKKI